MPVLLFGAGMCGRIKECKIRKPWKIENKSSI